MTKLSTRYSTNEKLFSEGSMASTVPYVVLAITRHLFPKSSHLDSVVVKKKNKTKQKNPEFDYKQSG